MPSPSYKELEAQIGECMLADRFRLRRELKKKKERGKLAGAVERSRQLVAERRHKIPQISYPEALPVSKSAPELIKAIQDNQVVIVAGETGSGKTTQLPKICLEAGRGVFGLIGHTQPRRVAARTIAHRLAEELKVSVGDEVGFQVRFQDQSKPSTLIKVMTDGVLLAETQNDLFLERYDTIIIDEAHERSLNIDFLLGYLKRILPKRPDLRLVITSATIDVDRFSRHFNDAPVFEVSGRTFPVDVQYRPLEETSGDDQDDLTTRAIINTLAEIDAMPNGDVLIFLPGEREIRETAREIKRKGSAGFEVLPLYSRLSISDQNRVFEAHKNRRIILATNVAETSLTVPGVRYVIDPGVARISRYSFRSKVQQLPIEAVSQASANQRKGRCGRVSEGVCFRLYSEEDFLGRAEFTEPEILRTNLASVILQMLQLKLGEIDRFPFLERPNQKQINDGFALLFELGAVDRGRSISRLGKQLARFPVDLRFARMLVAANQMGSLAEMLIITSALTIQDPRERPFDHQQAADEVHKQNWDECSDFLAFVSLWRNFEEKRQALGQGQLRKYCKQNFLSYMRMREWREMHRQLLLICKEQGFKEKREEAPYNSVHRALLTGLLGHVAVKAGEHDYQGARNQRQFIFPGSSQFTRKPKWILSSELVETSRLFARTVAEIESHWIESLAGHLVVRTHHDPVFDAEHGLVMVREEVTLYGIIIVADRKVDFGSVDQRNARALFIEQALVQGALRSRLKFFQNNRRLIRDIEQLESKARKRDILVESRALFDFYEQVLPKEVCSELDLRNFVNESPKNAGLMELTRDELMRREAELSETLYPNRMDVGGTSLRLKYKFEPGNRDDGVSVDVPLVLLGQVPRAQFDWIVPGLLEEKCLALIRSLPKSVRKNFIPAPDYVSRVLEKFDYEGKPLTEALADRLFRLSGTRVDPGDFQESNLERHLALNVRVIDDSGKLVANGRDFDQLVEQLGEKVSRRLEDRQQHTLEVEGLTDWSFDELPPSIAIREGGVAVTMYPALVDELDSVSIKLVETKWKALSLSAAGLMRLVMFRLKDQRKYLEKNIPGFDQFSLYFATRGIRAELTENIVKAAFSVTFVESMPPVRSRAEFDERLLRKTELFGHLEQIAKIVAQSLQQSLAIEDRLKTLPVRATAVDVRRQLDSLISSGFPFGIPFEWLRQYPRYFRGIALRLEKQSGNTEKDSAGIEALGQWWSRFEQADDASREKLNKFRWMLEEYRISLFAQSIGTIIPVSEKRLTKEWEIMMGKRK
ncbi:MAG: ATP-dependent RNA helicase HrpA [Candidatus Azotimanducaceae bacterium WSBS_2022_MAG_OTU7]